MINLDFWKLTCRFYRAPLSCSHTFIEDKVSGTFDIILKACPYGSGYGCAHTLKILWQSVTYTLENLSKYQVNESSTR